MNKLQDAAQAALHDQTQLLPKRELLFVFMVMSLAMLVSIIDQNAVGVLQPTIARELNARASISWTGTSALIGNATFQVLYGRMSDLFGRKRVIVSALVLLALTDLACGLSVNRAMLYVFRGLSGVAGGGINSLTMMIVSDIVTLQQRGKYQGILGVMTGLGNVLGPIIASSFAVRGTWRGIFYLLAPLVMVVAAVSWRWLPTNMPKLEWKQAFGQIDFLGLMTGTAAVILLLIPTSEAGHGSMTWDSPTVISMFAVGGACLIGFLLIEWKWARLPMMPLSLFRNRSVATMLGQTFLAGAGTHTLLGFVTLYLQNVRGKTPLEAAVYQLPLFACASLSNVAAGYYQSRFNRYIEIFWFGFGLWTIGGGLLITCGETTPLGLFCFYLVIIGIGNGCCAQPVLVALQACSPKAQRAVVCSNRNFLRSAGAAVGMAISSAILGNVLKDALPPHLASVAENTFARPDLSTYSDADRTTIIHAYRLASKAVFIWCAPLTGACFLLCALIRDRGLQRDEEKVAQALEGVVEKDGVRVKVTDLEAADGSSDGQAIETAVDEISPASTFPASTTPKSGERASGDASRKSLEERAQTGGE